MVGKTVEMPFLLQSGVTFIKLQCFGVGDKKRYLAEKRDASNDTKVVSSKNVKKADKQ
jgi:hypothetical protein